MDYNGSRSPGVSLSPDVCKAWRVAPGALHSSRLTRLPVALIHSPILSPVVLDYIAGHSRAGVWLHSVNGRGGYSPRLYPLPGMSLSPMTGACAHD